MRINIACMRAVGNVSYSGSQPSQSQNTSQEILSQSQNQNGMSQQQSNPLYPPPTLSVHPQQLAFEQLIHDKRQDQLLLGLQDILSEMHLMKSQITEIKAKQQV